MIGFYCLPQRCKLAPSFFSNLPEVITRLTTHLSKKYRYPICPSAQPRKRNRVSSYWSKPRHRGGSRGCKIESDIISSMNLTYYRNLRLNQVPDWLFPSFDFGCRSRHLAPQLLINWAPIPLCVCLLIFSFGTFRRRNQRGRSNRIHLGCGDASGA